MDNRQYYCETFSQVRFSGKLDIEQMEQRRRRMPVSRMLILAAVLSLTAAFGITAGAAGVLRLQSFVLHDVSTASSAAVSFPGDIVETHPTESNIPDTPKGMDTISLSGFAGSQEKQAVVEWQAFLDSYDPDYAILSAIGNASTGLEEKYGLYSVYTQEMADRLEEIVSRYGLKLHKELTEVPGTWELAAGGTFLTEAIQGFYGYMYEDGTFHFDGAWETGSGRTVSLQFGRWVKGSFHDVVLNIGNAEEYREWIYITACGVPVTLAVGSSKSLILTETEDAIITVNVLEGTERDYIGKTGGMTKELLETLADSIDFTVLSPVRKPNLPPEAETEQPHGDVFLMNTGIPELSAQAFYCAFYRAVEENDRMKAAEMFAWPQMLKLSTGEVLISSAKEFLSYYDEVFTTAMVEAMRHNQYTLERADLFVWEDQICGAGGEIRFGMVNGELKIKSANIPTTSWGIFGP